MIRAPRRRGIHTAAWWQRELAAVNARLLPYAEVTAEALTAEIQLQLNAIMLQEIGRAVLLVRTLALEHTAPPSTRRRRPRRATPPAPAVVVTHPGTTASTFRGPHVSAAQVRAIADQLTHAAEVLEAAQDGDGGTNQA